MKTILIVGGYGFLGTNILKYIEDDLREQYKVIVFDFFPINRAGLVLQCVTKSYAGDFSDASLIDKVFSENHIDLVIHSLSTTVPALSGNAKYDVVTNLLPTLELLNSMVRHDVLDIVYLSSGGAVYGESRGYAHKENDDVFPISSYGVVKLAIEKYMMQYATQYGLRPLILRLSNPYGPYHFSSRQGICNVAIDAALAKKPFTVWGDGTALKDYFYVQDFVKILFLLLQKGIHNEVINIGSGRMASVNEIMELIKRHVPHFEWSYGESSKYDVSQFELNTDKLKSFIGDFEFVSLEEGIDSVFKWKKGLE